MSTDRFDAAILIVDDQQANIQLIEHILRRSGYAACTSTTNPSEVCALHRKNGYDLIILDLQMPVMNGFEVLQALKDCNEHERPAILVMSADPSQMRAALTAGATSFLSKPFVLKEVRRQVHDLLGQTTSRKTERDAVAPAAA